MLYFSIFQLTLFALAAPLLGSLMAGLGGWHLGRKGAHRVTITLMAVSWLCSVLLMVRFWQGHADAVHVQSVPWMVSGGLKISLGFLVDRLSAAMMLVVTTIALLVHIYSIGYMHEDHGYQRFFSYMSAFSFAMLMLVTADNALQLFFGWEGVGLISYLLIGFWFQKPSAALGGYKAFIVNRVADLGLLLGLVLLFNKTGSLDYAVLFSRGADLATQTITLWGHHAFRLVDVICLLLFVGAMGKSAQMPLHVWLPESMEGPTPISALIHAATMVTAGIYLVIRFSPLFSHSPLTLSVVLVVGASGALFLGLVGLVQYDIKRIIAFSTLSQLGYMMAAAGASAFSAAMFHLMTHAFFKALLFLGAGSVILAMHHEQDIRKMGGLRSYLPITYVTFLIGSCALVALPPFSGYYSKDAIIEVVHLSTMLGSHYAYGCLLLGVLVTALYTFRLFFLTFHGKPRFVMKPNHLPAESSWVVWVPLVLLAIPSCLLGLVRASQFLYHAPSGAGWLAPVVALAPRVRPMLAHWAAEFPGVWAEMWSVGMQPSFWLTIVGIVVAFRLYGAKQARLNFERASRWFDVVPRVLAAQYGFNRFNAVIIVRSTRALAQFFYRVVDMWCIDKRFVCGPPACIASVSSWMRRVQSGSVSYYLMIMVFGLIGLWAGWLWF